MNATELAKESLIKLRKMANELGIQNYAKFSKEELAKLIEQKQNGIDTVIDPEMIASEEDVQNEAAMVAEHAATVTEDAVEPRPEDEAARREAKKAAKKEKKEKEKAPKTLREKVVKVVVDLSPKNEKKPELHETSSKIYDELMKNDHRSYGQIAKDLGTHYNMVRRVCETYFISTPVDQPLTETEETPAE